MSGTRRIVDAIRAYLPTLGQNEVVSDSYARAIASLYRSESLARLATTGEIDDTTSSAVRHELGLMYLAADQQALGALERYVGHHGTRGPVAGWTKHTAWN